MTDSIILTRNAVTILQEQLLNPAKRTAEQEAAESRDAMRRAITMLDLALQRGSEYGVR